MMEKESARILLSPGFFKIIMSNNAGFFSTTDHIH